MAMPVSQRTNGAPSICIGTLLIHTKLSMQFHAQGGQEILRFFDQTILVFEPRGREVRSSGRATLPMGQ
jgi:hypothetical protein